MKFHTATKVKILIVLISVLIAITVFKADSKNYSASSASNSSISIINSDATIYSRYCARCHGKDGKAQTPKGRQTGATNFTNPKWQAIEARGIRTITNGKEKMPAFKDTLSAEQIRSVWNYVRGFKKE